MTDAGHRERRDEGGGRVAFLACTGSTSEIRGGQGTLDCDAVRERLSQPDAGFTVRSLDARDDLAAQIEEALDALSERPTEVLLYVSARAMQADGELLLFLDPEHPDTGDALGDIVGALREGSGGAVLALLELRVTPGEDPLEPMEIARLGRQTARECEAEMVVAVGKRTEAQETEADACSPFTRALLEALDAADPEAGATASEVYETARDHGGVLGVVAAIAQAAVDPSFVLLPPVEVPVRSAPPPEPSDPVAAPDENPRDSNAELSAEAKKEEPPPEPPKPEPPKPEPAKHEPPKPVSLPPPPPSQSAPPPPTAKQVIEEADELERDPQDEDALARYRKALAIAATIEGSDSDRAYVYIRIGDVKHKQGKPREAIASFEKGLALDPKLPTTPRVLKTLLGLYFAERDHRGAYAIQQKLLGQIEDPVETTAALVVFARSWLDDVGDLLRAREALEQAAALSPADAAVVRLLFDLATREGRTEDALLLRRRLADLENNDRQKAGQLLALAKELITKHKREDEALDVLEAALEAEPSELEPLALLSALLGERQEWSELEGAYRRMLDRLPRIEDDALRSMLENEIGRRLGL
ncbi:MAG: tetratricopeptide repeat protein, partial [Polyangiaceae bacterium]|nr:tetratricopeptide repeat protein [Polyangiaceae bacterium]